MNRIILFPSILAAVIAISITVYLSRPSTYLPWHETPEWKRFLTGYDELLNTMIYADTNVCQTLDIDAASLGTTRTYACGNTTSDDMVVLIHGAQGAALMWGFSFTPALVKANKFTVVLEFPCDCGRSVPRDATNCAATTQEVATWVSEVVAGVKQKVGIIQKESNKVSLVGYSMGSLLSFATALHQPANLEIDQVIMLAPAATFANFQVKGALLGVVALVTKSKKYLRNLWKHMSAGIDEFSIESFYAEDPITPSVVFAANELGATVAKLWPAVFSDDQLASVCGTSDHRCMLGIGDNETVIDPVVAAERARRAGATVLSYPDTGHLMYYQKPYRTQIPQDVIEFLNRNKKEKPGEEDEE